MREKSESSPHSVDTALRLLHLLRDQGVVSVTEAAAALEVSTSTAQRLLGALAYRDFAARDEGRKYLAGPALSLRPGVVPPANALRQRYLPLMRGLAKELDETVSLGVRIGTRVRILATAEAGRLLRVGDQEGTVLPAHLAAIGKVLLATLENSRLTALYGPSPGSRTGVLPAHELAALVHELEMVRQVGFALNHGEAEAGVSAIAIPVTHDPGKVLSGLALAMPSTRFASGDVDRIVRILVERSWSV